jgi:hypothetical protein
MHINPHTFGETYLGHTAKLSETNLRVFCPQRYDSTESLAGLYLSKKQLSKPTLMEAESKHRDHPRCNSKLS